MNLQEYLTKQDIKKGDMNLYAVGVLGCIFIPPMLLVLVTGMWCGAIFLVVLYLVVILLTEIFTGNKICTLPYHIYKYYLNKLSVMGVEKTNEQIEAENLVKEQVHKAKLAMYDKLYKKYQKEMHASLNTELKDLKIKDLDKVQSLIDKSKAILGYIDRQRDE